MLFCQNNEGYKTLQLEDENMVSKFIKRATNKEHVREHGNIGQFWKGAREQGPPMGDPRNFEKATCCVTLCQLTTGSSRNSLEVSFFASSNTHCTSFNKILEAEVINATTNQNHIGSCPQNLLYSFFGNISFPERQK